jgi:uncharacterized membrane protein YraQ (UPF0718 family)
MNSAKIRKVSKKTFTSILKILPMLLAVVGLVGLFKAYVTPEILKMLFNGSLLHDELVGIVAGAVSVGQPFMSYIIGGELLKEGVSFYAVTAFLLSYITLGIIQIPMQLEIFGLRFTLILNALALVFSVVVSVATVVSIHFLETFL